MVTKSNSVASVVRYQFLVTYAREIIFQWYVLTQRSKSSVISQFNSIT